MSCEAAGIDGSIFVNKRRFTDNQREQDKLRQITSACVEAALTEMDWGEIPDCLRQSLQADYDKQTKK